MGSKKSILVIHPEGNIYNNPNLYEIILLLNQYYDVDILIPNLKINENITEFNKSIIEYNPLFNKLKNRIKNAFIYKVFFMIFQKIYITKKYDFIIGVDQLGVIDAYYLSKNQKSPYALISYEIFFESESPKNYKKLEIMSSKEIKFAVIQDYIRATYLSKENKIDINKMLCIPVSSSNSNKYIKSNYLYNELNIPLDKKILIYIGSVSDWSCIDKILYTVVDFPDDWVLVLHDRYGNTKEKVIKLVSTLEALDKIYFSNAPINSNYEMHKILHSADIGLALYCPSYSCIYTGKNLKYIGYASGKTSTYLQNGLPIITFRDTLFGKKMYEYNFGYAINYIDEIPTILSKYSSGILNEGSIKFFKEELDFDNFKEQLIERVEQAIMQT